MAEYKVTVEKVPAKSGCGGAAAVLFALIVIWAIAKSPSHKASTLQSLPTIDPPTPSPTVDESDLRSKVLEDQPRIRGSLNSPPRDTAKEGLAIEADANISVVQAWNDAHNGHDAASLHDLYAAEVDFYGHILPVDKVVAIKASLLSKTPDFRQEVSGFDVKPVGDGRISVSFHKRWVSNGKPGEIDCSLELRRIERLVITKETDASVQFK